LVTLHLKSCLYGNLRERHFPLEAKYQNGNFKAYGNLASFCANRIRFAYARLACDQSGGKPFSNSNVRFDPLAQKMQSSPGSQDPGFSAVRRISAPHAKRGRLLKAPEILARRTRPDGISTSGYASTPWARHNEDAQGTPHDPSTSARRLYLPSGRWAQIHQC